LAATLRPARQQSSVSSLERYRAQVLNWRKAGLQGTTSHSAPVRMLGYTGSCSSVRRFLRALEPSSGKATSPMVFEPGEAVQVDFGRGPSVPYAGAELLTWVFVMTLCQTQ
jgi:hypothetical protein